MRVTSQSYYAANNALLVQICPFRIVLWIKMSLFGPPELSECDLICFQVEQKRKVQQTRQLELKYRAFVQNFSASQIISLLVSLTNHRILLNLLQKLSITWRKTRAATIHSPTTRYISRLRCATELVTNNLHYF